MGAFLGATACTPALRRGAGVGMLAMGGLTFATGAALTNPCITDPHRYRCDEPVVRDGKEAGAVMLASGLVLMLAGGVTVLNSNLGKNNGGAQPAPKPKP